MSINYRKSEIRKKTLYQGLDKYPVLLIDDSKTSSEYFNLSELPTQFNSGKNIIKLYGNSTNLLRDSQLKVELIDANGEPIYLEYKDYADRFGRRYIIAYIHSDTAYGYATLTIIGTAKYISEAGKPKIDVPFEWRNKPNLKWQTIIKVDPLARNDSEIIFENPPIVNIEELFQPYIQTTTGVSSSYMSPYIGDGQGWTIIPNTGLSSRVPSMNQANHNDSFTSADVNKLSIELNSLSADKNRLSPTNGTASYFNVSEFRRESTDVVDFDYNRINTQRGVLSYEGLSKYDIDVKQIPISGTSIIRACHSSNDQFSTQMLDGMIKIPKAFIQSASAPAGYSFLSDQPADYYGKIVRIFDAFTIEVTPQLFGYIAPTSGSNVLRATAFTIPSAFLQHIEVTHSIDLTYSSSQAYRNIAHINISNIENISGDVYKIRTYAKSTSDTHDYKLLSDNVLSSRALLIDENAPNINAPIGYFKDENSIRPYWQPTLIYSSSAETPFKAVDVPLLSSVRLGCTGYNNSGAVIFYPTYKNPKWQTGGYDARPYELSKGDVYEFVATLVFDPTDANMYSSVATSSLEIVATGSAFDSIDEININNLNIANGRIIGNIITTSPFSRVNYNRLSFKFRPDHDGNSAFYIITKGAYWYLSDVQINSVREPGYNPSTTVIDIPISPMWDNDLFNFKFEFINFKGDPSDQYLYLKNVPIQNGSAAYIQGVNNLMTGSTFLAHELRSGIEFNGAAPYYSNSKLPNTGSFIRAYNYDGFSRVYASGTNPGWILWNGDVQFTYEAMDSYFGSGIEMAINKENFLRLSTKKNSLELQTQNCVIGSNSPTSSYISSSDNGTFRMQLNPADLSFLPGSGSFDVTSSHAISASYANFAETSSYTLGTIESASYSLFAETASYANFAETSSYSFAISGGLQTVMDINSRATASTDFRICSANSENSIYFYAGTLAGPGHSELVFNDKGSVTLLSTTKSNGAASTAIRSITANQSDHLTSIISRDSANDRAEVILYGITGSLSRIDLITGGTTTSSMLIYPSQIICSTPRFEFTGSGTDSTSSFNVSQSIQINGRPSAIFLYSENGTRYKIAVSNAGALTATLS